uniref:Uncharacterized protein n=1 Tax=Arion vulgaris TaxID=1028688 RepID=A0A0B6ZPD2_9EUPU
MLTYNTCRLYHSTCMYVHSSSDLLSFKAHDIAEQMTLLDAQLFQKIEVTHNLICYYIS